MADTTKLLDEKRLDLCLAAVWELDKIGRTLPGIVPLDEEQTHYAVKAFAGRMLRLTSALMDALQDDASNEAIANIVNFEEGTSQG